MACSVDVLETFERFKYVTRSSEGFPRSPAWWSWPLTSDTFFMSILSSWGDKPRWGHHIFEILNVFSGNLQCHFQSVFYQTVRVFLWTLKLLSLSGELITGVRLLGRKVAANSVPHVSPRQTKEGERQIWLWLISAKLLVMRLREKNRKHIKHIPTDTCAPCVPPSMHVHTQNAGRQATADWIKVKLTGNFVKVVLLPRRRQSD